MHGLAYERTTFYHEAQSLRNWVVRRCKTRNVNVWLEPARKPRYTQYEEPEIVELMRRAHLPLSGLPARVPADSRCLESKRLIHQLNLFGKEAILLSAKLLFIGSNQV